MFLVFESQCSSMYLFCKGLQLSVDFKYLQNSYSVNFLTYCLHTLLKEGGFKALEKQHFFFFFDLFTRTIKIFQVFGTGVS